MSLYDIFGNIYFNSFQDVVTFMASGAPVWLLTFFTVNCLFSIAEDIFSFGGKK